MPRPTLLVTLPLHSTPTQTSYIHEPPVNPQTAYHKSIYEPEFSVEWFGTFDIVLNALDNLGTSNTNSLTHSGKSSCQHDVSGLERSAHRVGYRRVSGSSHRSRSGITTRTPLKARASQNASTAIQSLPRRPTRSAQLDPRPRLPSTASCGQRHFCLGNFDRINLIQNAFRQ